jgi:hypothetical protein
VHARDLDRRWTDESCIDQPSSDSRSYSILSAGDSAESHPPVGMIDGVGSRRRRRDLPGHVRSNYSCFQKK